MYVCVYNMQRSKHILTEAIGEFFSRDTFSFVTEQPQKVK